MNLYGGYVEGEQQYWTQKDLAVLYGCGVPNICKITKKLGLDLKTSVLTIIDWPEEPEETRDASNEADLAQGLRQKYL